MRPHCAAIKRAFYIGFVGCVMTACAAPQPEVKTSKKRSKEYFAESVYGVKASPRVANGKKIPRGGGRNQIGKPYKVKDKWYRPKEEPNYSKTGRASWYGSAFHGRLTANGEVYDMTHLTGAHPTMPLPSYARVTNTANGSSVIVRINDRGPYSNDRIIDMSEKAAEMLDYKHHGTANVKVEYVGRAPLDGQDDAFLLASFRPGGDAIGQPASGVMMAMNGPTPTANPQHSNNAFNQLTMPQAGQQNSAPVPFGFADGASLQVPAMVPVPLDKPDQLYNLAASGEHPMLAAYAPAAQAGVENAYARILQPQANSAQWRQTQLEQMQRNDPEQGEYVDLGSFSTLAEAEQIAARLQRFGTISRTTTMQMQGALYSLTAKAASGENDALLQAAWQAGAIDAFVVRAQ